MNAPTWSLPLDAESQQTLSDAVQHHLAGKVTFVDRARLESVLCDVEAGTVTATKLDWLLLCGDLETWATADCDREINVDRLKREAVMAAKIARLTSGKATGSVEVEEKVAVPKAAQKVMF